SARGRRGKKRVARRNFSLGREFSSMRESAPAPDTHFGFRTVPLDAKQRLVDDVFHKVARRYDVMNDLMSGGLHRAWKDALVTAVNPPKSERDFALLDVAGGTGAVSFRTIAAGGAGTRATVCGVRGGWPVGCGGC